MIESYVDLTYRGLALGRRIKLTQVRPTTGYLELPLPMPVGTQIAISTDEGVALEAVVVSIHEQVGGSDRVPGMTVKPALGAEAALSWWQARVAMPEASDNASPSRDKPVTVRPRTHTVPAPPPAGATEDAAAEAVAAEASGSIESAVQAAAAKASAAPPAAGDKAEKPRPAIKEEDIKRTTVMNAVDQELLAKLTSSEGEVEHLVRRTGEHEVVDDGLRTTVMESVDVSALGIEVSASGSFRAAGQSGELEAAGDDDESSPADSKPAGGKKKKRKRR